MSNLSISSSIIKDVKLILTNGKGLHNNDIIIYNVFLPNFNHLRADLFSFLNPKEVKKSERFYKDIDRDRYIIYRSILKIILASHTKLEVQNINLNIDFNKKPYLASHPWLFFNISHSEDYAVIAISNKKVGIDIEYMREDFKFTNLLPDIYDDDEILSIENSPNKKQAFYTLWTRKEAFVKALGKGIDEDFKYIPCLDGNHKIDYAILKNTENWQVLSFDLTDHYVASIAFEGKSSIPKNLMLHDIPNTMEGLLGMTEIAKEY